METVQLAGWKPGLKKVSLDKLVQKAMGGGLKPAKEKVDRLLEGERVSLHFGNREEAEAFLAEAASLGAVGHLQTVPRDGSGRPMAQTR